MKYSLVQIADIAAADEPLLQPVAPGDAQPTIVSQHVLDDHNMLPLYARAARRAVEGVIHRPIGVQTFELGLPSFYDLSELLRGIDVFACGLTASIELPKAPLVALLSIKYMLYDGTVQTLFDSAATPPVTSDLFIVDTSGDPGALYLRPYSSWPIDLLAPGYPVKIRFTAGFNPVPDDLLAAMCLMAGHLNENREAVVSDIRVQALQLPIGVDELCAPYIFERFV